MTTEEAEKILADCRTAIEDSKRTLRQLHALIRRLNGESA